MIGCPRRFPFSWSPATEKVDLRFFFLLQFLAIFASISGHVIDVRSTYPDQFRSVSYIYIHIYRHGNPACRLFSFVGGYMWTKSWSS